MANPNLNRKARLRALSGGVLIFIIVLGVLWFGKSSMNLDDGEYLKWFGAFRDSEWVYLIVLGTFVIGAFLGVPQWMLIAGSVFALGPWLGGALAWASTLVSGTTNFWIGRWAGATRIERFGGERIKGFIQIIRKNGFLASMTVRMVPTGPFILVNMAGGASGMTFVPFLAGMSVGIVPKILIVTLLGQGFLSPNQERLYMVGFMILALCVGALIYFLRRKLAHLVETDNSS